MKRTFTAILCVMLTVILLASAVLPASAEALKDPYSDFIFNLWSEYSKECEKLTGYAPPTPAGGIAYREISEYSPSTDDESKNFKLIFATYGTTEETYSYRKDFGEYTYYNSFFYSNSREYLIYLYNQDLVYTIEEAYYNNVEGLEPALGALYGEVLLKNGDTNGDFEVNVKDATFLQKYTAKLESVNKIYSLELFKRSADINRDHKINVKDATLLQKQLAKLVVPTVYDKTPASADSVEYTQTDLAKQAGYAYSDFANADKLITTTNQLNSYDNSPKSAYNAEFFEEKALVHIYHTYYSGMVKGSVTGVYRDDDTLYVKYSESHPPYGQGHTTDIGILNVALEIDKSLLEGVTKLSIDTNAYNRAP